MSHPTKPNTAHDTTELRTLLRYTLLALIACTLAVVICYFWIDRFVAFYVYHHDWAKVALFKQLTFIPPTVQTWSPLVIALLILRRTWSPWSLCEHALFVACLSLIVADEFRTSLGELFGRYWPETWIRNNPSLIGTDSYGFHPFQIDDDAGDNVGSFPSGHSARITGFLGVFWILPPRARWLYVLLALPMLFSLVAMDYHFVGDVIAGSTLGGIVATYAVYFAGIKAGNAERSRR
jgi:membrane-associated phospholipid phosphatase